MIAAAMLCYVSHVLMLPTGTQQRERYLLSPRSLSIHTLPPAHTACSWTVLDKLPLECRFVAHIIIHTASNCAQGQRPLVAVSEAPWIKPSDIGERSLPQPSRSAALSTMTSLAKLHSLTRRGHNTGDGKTDLLLRFFESHFFDEWIALQ